MNRALHLLAGLALAAATGCATRSGGADTASGPAHPPRPPVTLAMPANLSDADFAPWLEGERSRVAAARSAAHQRFHDEELACWQRFAVNACVRKARVERRAAIDRLRQEDLLLNEMERQRRTAERLRALERKQPQKGAPQGAGPVD